MWKWIKENIFGQYETENIVDFFKKCKTLKDVAERVAINISYKTDRNAWKLSDYWQTPAETLKYRTGDCEDMACLALEGIRLIGNTEAKTTSYVLAVYGKRFGHAVAVCKQSGKWVIIDPTHMNELFWYAETNITENDAYKLSKGILDDVVHYELIQEPKYGKR